MTGMMKILKYSRKAIDRPAIFYVYQCVVETIELDVSIDVFQITIEAIIGETIHNEKWQEKQIENAAISLEERFEVV